MDPPLIHTFINTAVQTHGVIPISTINPKYLHTNSTSHTWPFSAIAELIDNAYDPDVRAKQFWIDKTVVKEQDCLIFMDNGAGMDYNKMHKMLSFGFSDKKTVKGHVPVGLYGNGFKSGSMRLGKDAIVFSKKADIMCVGLLSQTYLQKIKAENITVPIVMFKTSGDTLSCEQEFNVSLQDILRYSLFNTKEELLCELNAINGPSGKNSTGTRIIIWNLHRTSSDELEFDFEFDQYDIRIPVDTYESTKEQNRRLERGTSPPESKYSLRAYTSILYLKPRMQINIRGQKVKTLLVSKSLAYTIKDTYKPTFLKQKRGIPITFGYNTKTKEHYGVMMYHKNRLIKAYERVTCQDKVNRIGVGVIGVIEYNYLSPTHNKQEFDNTDEYRRTMQNLNKKLEDYWKEVRQRRKQNINSTEPVEDLEKVPDQTWVQCDECMKWRKLPDGINSELLPDKWFCRLNPDPQFRSCSAEEEPEDSVDEEPRYQKTYKQHEKNQRLQEEKNRQQKEQEQKRRETQRIEALAKQNAALLKKQQDLVPLLRLGTRSSPRSPAQATTSFVPHMSLGTRESDNLPDISCVTPPSTPSRNKRALDPSQEDGMVKRLRTSLDGNKPDSPSTSSEVIEQPQNLSELNMREGEGQEENGVPSEQEDEQIDLLQRELDQRTKERDELKKKSDSLESENHTLSESCEFQRTKLDQRNKERDELKKKLDSLESENRTLSESCDRLQRELDQRNKERDELKKKLDCLESENCTLSESFKSLREDLQKAKREMEQLRVSAAQQAQVAAALPKALNPGREPRLGTQQDEIQEAPENRLKELRQNVARLLVTFVPALDLQQVNYDCDVIDEILSQVIDDIHHTDSSTIRQKNKNSH